MRTIVSTWCNSSGEQHSDDGSDGAKSHLPRMHAPTPSYIHTNYNNRTNNTAAEAWPKLEDSDVMT